MNYYREARKRAERRKSKWNLLLIPAVVSPLIIIWYFSCKVIGVVHNHFHAGQDFMSHPVGLGAILAGLSPFFGALPVSMLIGNMLVWLIPPARRVLDDEAGNIPGARFINAQRTLVKMAFILVPIGYGLALLGAYLPWYESST